MVVDGDRKNLLGVVLADHIVVENLADFLRRRNPVRDFASDDLLSSQRMSLHSST